MEDLNNNYIAKDEKESLPIVIKNLKPFECEIIITIKYDDIETLKAIKNENVKIFLSIWKRIWKFSQRSNESCKSKYFCIFNADGSFDHNDLPKMYKEIRD